MNWRKWIDTPRWRVLIAVQLVTAMAFAIYATIGDTKWIARVDAFLAGVNFALAYHSMRMAQMFATFEQMKHAFESMCNINKGLVEAQVGTLTIRLAQESDEDIPIAPNRLN